MKINVAGNLNFDPLHFSKIDPNLRAYIDPTFCSHNPRNQFVIFREYIDSELKHGRLAIIHLLYEYTKNIYTSHIFNIIIVTFGFLELYKLYLMRNNPNWMPGSYFYEFNEKNKFQYVVNGKFAVTKFQIIEVWLGRFAMIFFLPVVFVDLFFTF